MSAEIVNLRRARKAKARRQEEERAAENRVAFGRSKADRAATRAGAALDARRLEAHRREEGAASADEGRTLDAPGSGRATDETARPDHAVRVPAASDPARAAPKPGEGAP